MQHGQHRVTPGAPLRSGWLVIGFGPVCVAVDEKGHRRTKAGGNLRGATVSPLTCSLLGHAGIEQVEHLVEGDCRVADGIDNGRTVYASQP